VRLSPDRCRTRNSILPPTRPARAGAGAGRKDYQACRQRDLHSGATRECHRGQRKRRARIGGLIRQATIAGCCGGGQSARIGLDPQHHCGVAPTRSQFAGDNLSQAVARGDPSTHGSWCIRLRRWRTATTNVVAPETISLRLDANLKLGRRAPRWCGLPYQITRTGTYRRLDEIKRLRRAGNCPPIGSWAAMPLRRLCVRATTTKLASRWWRQPRKTVMTNTFRRFTETGRQLSDRDGCSVRHISRCGQWIRESSRFDPAMLARFDALRPPRISRCQRRTPKRAQRLTEAVTKLGAQVMTRALRTSS